MNRRNLKRYKFGEAFYGKVPKDQAKKMALLWGEKSENLTNLIEYCILNDIGTFASCKGHSEYSQGYIGFTKMPKEFFEFIMDYMMDYMQDFGMRYDISRLGDQKPRLVISSFSSTNDREEMFKKILNGVKEYTITKDKLDLSNIDKTFYETVEYIFLKEGFGKEREFLPVLGAGPYRNMPEFSLDEEGKFIYHYSLIARFCRSSKKTLSAIRKVPERIKEQLQSKANEIEGKGRE